MRDEEMIQITFGEYKELLIIKGKYEELKSNPRYYPTITSPYTLSKNPDTIGYTTISYAGGKEE